MHFQNRRQPSRRTRRLERFAARAASLLLACPVPAACLPAIALVAAATLAAPAAAHAQTTGTISGTVRDKGGALIPGVKVEARNAATGVVRTATTNGAGEYSFPALPPGDYGITYTLTGFVQQVETATLNVTEAIAVNTTLQVGDVSTTVQVTDQQPLLQTDSVTLGDVISGASVEQLPLATNNFTQLLALSPGVIGPVNDSTALGRGTQNYNVNGARTNSNSVYIDGVDAVNVHVNSLSNNSFGSNGVVIPPIDDIQEIKIQTGLFDASTGRSGGSNTFVITKSGGNAIHGDIYDYFRNTIFNANSYFLKQAGVRRPELQQNQYGVTIGGGIIKDRLFGFFGYQGTRQNNGYAGRTSVAMPNIPTDRSLASLGAFGASLGATSYAGPTIATNGSNISTVAYNLLNLKLPNGQYVIPSPQVSGLYAASNVSRFDEDEYIGSMDYQLGSRDRLSFNTVIAEQPQFYATASIRYVPGFGLSQLFKSRLYTIGETHIFTPNLVNTFHLGLNRLLGHTVPQNQFPLTAIGMTRFNSSDFPDIPEIELSSSFELGYSTNADQSDTDNTWEYFDNASYLKGKHNMNFGVEMRRYQDNYYSNYEMRGSLDFISFQNFLLGENGSATASGGNGTGHSDIYQTIVGSGLVQRYDRIRDIAGFFSDNWKVTNRLTLITGLRYEYIGLPTDLYGRNGAFELANYQAPATGGTTSIGFVQDGNARNPVPGIAKFTNTLTNTVSKLNFGPRIGFAYGLTQRLVLRGGYGLFYDRLSNQLGLLESLSLPNFEGVSSTNGSKNSTYNLTSSLANPFPTLPLRSQFPIQPLLNSQTVQGAATPISINDIDPNLRTPYYQQFGLQLQAELPHNFLVQVGYVGATGDHLPSQTEINQAIIASPTNPVNGVTTNNTGVTTGTPDTAAARAPYQGLSNSGLIYIQTNQNSNFNSFQGTVIERFKRATLTATYMYSKSLDDGSGTTDGSVFTTWTGDQTNPQQAYGPSDFNRTHRATLRFTQPIPKPNWSFANHGVGAALLTNYEVSAIGVIQTGVPIDLTNAGGGAYYGTNTSRASYAPGVSSSAVARKSGTTEKRINSYFNNGTITSAGLVIPDRGTGAAAVFVPAGNYYGNVGRNTLVGPGSRNLDLSLIKFIPIHDSVKAEFRAQAFNLTNTPNFANPGSDPSSAVSSTNYGSFGVISATVGNPRILQFVLKLDY